MEETTDYETYADYPHIGIDSIEKDTGRLYGYRTVKEAPILSATTLLYATLKPDIAFCNSLSDSSV